MGGTNLRRYSVSIEGKKRTKAEWTKRRERQTGKPKVKGAVYPWKRSNGSAGIRKNDKSHGGSPRSFVVAAMLYRPRCSATYTRKTQPRRTDRPTPFFHLAIRKKSAEERSARLKSSAHVPPFLRSAYGSRALRGRKSEGSGCWRIAVYGQGRSEWNRHWIAIFVL